MSVISGIVLEELERNLAMQKNYSKRLDSFIKGSLVYKKRNSKIYCYLSYRDNEGIPKYKYIGIKDSAEEEECIKSIENYRYFKNQIKHLKEEEVDMRKMLKAVNENVNV